MLSVLGLAGASGCNSCPPATDSHATASKPVATPVPGNPAYCPPGGAVSECSDALAAFFKTDLYKPPTGEREPGDHLVLCVEDEENPGALVVQVLSDDPKVTKAQAVATLDYRAVGGKEEPRKARVIRVPAPVVEVGEPDRAVAVAGVAQPAAGAAAGAALFLSAAAEANVAAKVLSGSTAKGAGMTNFGTAGWNLIFSDTLVCVSNHHVLCRQPNPAAGNVVLAGQVQGTLRSRQTLQFLAHPNDQQPANRWDVAMAAFNNNADAAAQMLHCPVPAYPKRLAPPGALHRNDVCRFDGAQSGCANLTFVGKGEGRIHLYDRNIWFADQLLFAFNTGGQDSGALIIRDVDSESLAVGLHMAKATATVNGRTVNYSMANPLYRAKWTYIGPGTAGGNPATFSKFTPVSPVGAPECFDPGVGPE